METGNSTNNSWRQMFHSLRGPIFLNGTFNRKISSLNPENRMLWLLFVLFLFVLIYNGLFSRSGQFYNDYNKSLTTKTQMDSLLSPANQNFLKNHLANAKNFKQIQKETEFWEIPLELIDSIPSASPLKRNAFFLSSKYGIRQHPIKHSKTIHHGVDLATKKGTPIFASAAGTIIHIGYEPKGYGHFVRIKHSFGFETLYGHLNEVVLKVATKIKAQQLIGYSGNTGFSTGPHLHYEVIKNGKAIDPIPSFGMKYRIFEQRLHTITNKNIENEK